MSWSLSRYWLGLEVNHCQDGISSIIHAVELLKNPAKKGICITMTYHGVIPLNNHGVPWHTMSSIGVENISCYTMVYHDHMMVICSMNHWPWKPGNSLFTIITNRTMPWYTIVYCYAISVSERIVSAGEELLVRKLSAFRDSHIKSHRKPSHKNL